MVTSTTDESAGDAEGRSDESLGRQQYLTLRRELVHGVYPLGTLLSETEVSARTGVSRTPAREALTLLVHDGFLVKKGKAYQVRGADGDTIVELYETRIALECTLAAAAAFRRSDLDLSRLAHAQQLLSEAKADQTGPTSELFHQALWRASRNRPATEILQRITDLIQLFERDALQADTNVKETIAEHELILDGIRERDGEKAQNALAAHLGRTRDVRLAYYATRYGLS